MINADELNKTYNDLRNDVEASFSEIIKEIRTVVYMCDKQHIEYSVQLTFDSYKCENEAHDLHCNLYYNDHNGDERLGFLLAVSSDGFIHLIDNEENELQVLELSDFNGLTYKIEIIDAIEDALIDDPSEQIITSDQIKTSTDRVIVINTSDDHLVAVVKGKGSHEDNIKAIEECLDIDRGTSNCKIQKTEEFGFTNTFRITVHLWSNPEGGPPEIVEYYLEESHIY